MQNQSVTEHVAQLRKEIKQLEDKPVRSVQEQQKLEELKRRLVRSLARKKCC